jgi:SAM-dependent methyltransferase
MPRDRTRRVLFDSVADIYASGRPEYPDSLFADLFDRTGVRPPAHVLEIGCGPGTATVPIAQRGYRVTAVELGARLARKAESRLAAYPSASVHVGDFENWVPVDTDPIDLVYAANTWSWIEPDVKYRKAASLLKPGGYLAVWDTAQEFSNDETFFAELQGAYTGTHEETRPENWPPRPPTDLGREFTASGLFDVVNTDRYLWSVEYNAQQYCDLLSTFAGHLALADTDRRRVFAEVRRLIEARPSSTVRREWIAIATIGRSR